ncbi:MAG TPA: pitrilysin family protein [Candidatus Nitrosotenuis sp.]|jgi:predicted Zn-dependent peptidase|nr:pitrilysin family protein [Candidatus Nitrosotenuis sp.]
MVGKTVLDNGLTVVTELLPEFRSCTLGIWVRTGSRYERPDEAGLSHFIEHMFFKGTRRRTASEIAEAMDAVGGNLNAFTEKEQTCYYARVMDEHLPVALDILSDMLLHSRFDEEEMAREKGVILEEIKMYEDAPDELIFDLFTRALWGDHPLGRPILGEREVVAGLTREKLCAYLQRHYVPSKILVAAAGRVDHDHLAEEVSRWYAADAPAAPGDEAPAPTTRPGVTVYSRDVEQVYLCYGTEGLRVTDERRYALLVLDSILGGSTSSRLFQEIREKRGLVYTVCTFQNSYSDAGVFGVYAGTSAEKLEEVLALIRKILVEVRGQGLTDAELRRAREHLKGSMALALESTSSRMTRLARSETYHGRVIPLEELIARIDAVTHADVMELAETMLDPARYTLTVLGPLDRVEGVPAEPLPVSRSLRERAAARSAG